MLSKCIGIISYLPNKWSHRNNRIIKLITLLDKVNNLFNLPIILLAQNYKPQDISRIKLDNMTILEYEKPLGIALARETLRKYFLSSKYDVIILLDDDCEIIGNDASEYLRQIDNNPNKLGAMHDALHKLMSIPRNIYEKYSYDLVNTPDNHIAFEDSLFYWPLIAEDNKQKFNFINTGLKDISKSRKDKLSSWSNQLDMNTLMKMSRTTDSLIEQRTGKNIMDIYALEGYKQYISKYIDE